jgi:hypothetical protein
VPAGWQAWTAAGPFLAALSWLLLLTKLVFLRGTQRPCRSVTPSLSPHPHPPPTHTRQVEATERVPRSVPAPPLPPDVRRVFKAAERLAYVLRRCGLAAEILQTRKRPSGAPQRALHGGSTLLPAACRRCASWMLPQRRWAAAAALATQEG